MDININFPDVMGQEIELLEKELSTLYGGLLYVRSEHNNTLLKKLNIKREILETQKKQLEKTYTHHKIDTLPVYTKIYQYRKNKLIESVEKKTKEIKTLEEELTQSINVNLNQLNTRKIQDVKWKLMLAKESLNTYAMSGVISDEAIRVFVKREK